MEKKKKIGVVFGGRSSEHEISILSAASVLAVLDREQCEPVPIYIDKAGGWHLIGIDIEGLCDLNDPRISDITLGSRRVTIADFDSMTDFAFPLLHGPYGEDGTIQGLFEMLDKPYAGCGVAASAISMDKIFTKKVWIQAGLPVCDHTFTTKAACEIGIADEAARMEREIPYPIFVKPANMGSSVGVSKVSDRAAFEAAIRNAFKYDKRVITEQTICGRELEIGLTGNATPEFSAIGEIFTDAVYYDYDSKYRSSSTKLAIPAVIPDSVKDEIETLALKAYMALDGEGFARVDLFYDEEHEKVYLNEMNTIPGFTQYSMFPLLWQAKGVKFAALVEKIIELGYERYCIKNNR